MALNDKTPPWSLDNDKTPPRGLDIEDRLKTKGKRATEPDTHADTDTHTDTDKYTANSKFVVARETKSKRLYLLVKPSVHQKIAEYADATGDTTNNIINTLMEEFVAKHGL